MTVINDDISNIKKYVPETSVDCIIYDPPYGIGNSKLEHKQKKWNKSSEDWDTFESPDEQYAFYIDNLNALSPLLKNTGSIFAFGSFHNMYMIGDILQRYLKFKIINSITWYKINAFFSVTRSSLIESTEHIIWAGKSKDFYFNYNRSKQFAGGKQMRNVWTSPITGAKERCGHPHQKPFWLIERLLLIGCPAGGLVLDPMAGSGITGMVCETSGYPYILNEKNGKYFKMIQKNIKTHKENFTVDMFSETKDKKIKIVDMFKE